MQQKRLLIVDDNRTNREILVRQSQAWGMYPVAVESGPAALKLLAEDEHFDLAILDMQMPDMDGLDLARAIHSLPRHVPMPLLMLTSIGQQELRQKQEGINLAGIMTKPVKRTQLLEVLMRVVSQGVRTIQTSAAATTRSVFRNNQTERLDPGLRILLAEDNLINQKVALRTLERLGYRADAVSDGAEVLVSLQRQVYDVVLMDVQMPVLDGLEATIRLRQELPAHRQPFVIAMTANAMQGDRENCMAAGMDAYLSKPFKVEELVDALQNSRILPGRSDRFDHYSNGSEKMPNDHHPPRPLRRLYSRQPDPIVVVQPEESVLHGPINWDTLHRLQLDLGEDSGSFLGELIERFLADTPVNLEKMEQALTDSEFSLVHRTAHSLKSTAKILGADLLSGLCKDLEEETAHLYGQAKATTDHLLSESVRGQMQGIVAEYARVHTALYTADLARIAADA